MSDAHEAGAHTVDVDASATQHGGAGAVVPLNAWGQPVAIEDGAAFDAWLDANEPVFVARGARATAARETSDRIAAAVARTAGRPQDVDAVLDGLLGGEMPGDPGWREVVSSLREAPSGLASLKLLCLARYRRHLLRGLGVAGDEAETPVAAPPEAHAGQRRRGLLRLERGKRLVVQGAPGQPIEIWLAGRRYQLELGPEARLTDPLGHSTVFREGANLVGRAAYAEVVVESSHSDVSRRHLVVEVRDRRVVALTDLSSRGTCVPPALLT